MYFCSWGMKTKLNNVEYEFLWIQNPNDKDKHYGSETYLFIYFYSIVKDILNTESSMITVSGCTYLFFTFCSVG